MLKQNGYSVKVINLLEMDKSDCYNPFSYIREETDVFIDLRHIIHISHLWETFVILLLRCTSADFTELLTF